MQVSTGKAKVCSSSLLPAHAVLARSCALHILAGGWEWLCAGGHVFPAGLLTRLAALGVYLQPAIGVGCACRSLAGDAIHLG